MHYDGWATQFAERAFATARDRGRTGNISDLPLGELIDGDDLALVVDCPQKQCEGILRGQLRWREEQERQS